MIKTIQLALLQRKYRTKYGYHIEITRCGNFWDYRIDTGYDMITPVQPYLFLTYEIALEEAFKHIKQLNLV